MIKLFVGLGNPGNEYEQTRHNAGFWWVDALARELKVSLANEKGYQALVARANVHGHTVWLLEPQTFMNLSGRSVAALAACVLLPAGAQSLGYAPSSAEARQARENTQRDARMADAM
jgi:PTH1 family peptidyl-tRNA hydrolase